MKLNLYISPYTKLNSKWVKGLVIRPVQIIEEVGPNLHHGGLRSDFLNMISKAKEIKPRINKWDRFKRKGFF